MKKLFELIKAHRLYAVLIAVVVIVLLFAASNGIGRSIEAYRANRFDKAQQAHEKEVAGLKAEREAIIKRANDAEAKALLKESEATELRELIAAKGGSIEAAAKEMEKKLDEAKQGAGDCQTLTNDADRLRCVCDKLKRAGFECT